MVSTARAEHAVGGKPPVSKVSVRAPGRAGAEQPDRLPFSISFIDSRDSGNRSIFPTLEKYLLEGYDVEDEPNKC